MLKNVESIVLSVIKEVSNLDISAEQIKLEDQLSSFGITSLGFIKVIVGLEKEFDLEFDDNNLNIEKFNKVGNLITYINDVLRNRN